MSWDFKARSLTYTIYLPQFLHHLNLLPFNRDYLPFLKERFLFAYNNLHFQHLHLMGQNLCHTQMGLFDLLLSQLDLLSNLHLVLLGLHGHLFILKIYFILRYSPHLLLVAKEGGSVAPFFLN